MKHAVREVLEVILVGAALIMVAWSVGESTARMSEPVSIKFK